MNLGVRNEERRLDLVSLKFWNEEQLARVGKVFKFFDVV